MKKWIWIIIFAAAALLAVGLFLCLRPKDPGGPEQPALPTAEAAQRPSLIPGSAGTGASEGGELPPAGGSPEAAATEPELPVDWNRESDAPEQSAERPSSPGGTPAPSGSPGQQPSGTAPTQTESENGTEPPEETGGEAGDPILPPDIFH